MRAMLRWYTTEMTLLYMYSRGWALRYGVPGRRWLAIILLFQGAAMATAWLFVSPIIRHDKPPVLKAWWVGRCQAYMLGKSWEQIKDGTIYSGGMWNE